MTVETPIEELALTRSQINALRSADTLAFCSNRDGNYIRATKERFDAGDGYEACDVSVMIPTLPPDIENYNTKDSDGDCFGASVRCGFNRPVQTFLSFLKVGDLLSAKFKLGNDSESMKDVGITRDDLSVVVERGPKKFEFMLDTNVGKVGGWRMRFRG